MEIKKLLDEINDSGMKEFLMLFLSGWMDRINRKQEMEDPQKYESANKRFQSWEEMVKEKYPELQEENQEFLSWVSCYYEEKLENYYLYGLCDGIRVLKWMIKL